MSNRTAVLCPKYMKIRSQKDVRAFIPQQGSHKRDRPEGRAIHVCSSVQMLKKMRAANYLACMEAKEVTHPR